MDLISHLTGLKKKTMQKITEAAAATDTKQITFYGALANRIDQDERLVSEVMTRANEYEKQLADPAATSLLSSILDEIKGSRSDSRKVRSNSGREDGASKRQAFIDAGIGRGYHLLPRGKTTFQTNKGHRLAIPFANEQRPDRWFLGISDEMYDVVVLLCQETDGELFDFVIPREFLEKFWRTLSRSGGQVKLNVSRSGKSWFLLIPGDEPQVIDTFLGNYGPLRI